MPDDSEAMSLAAQVTPTDGLLAAGGAAALHATVQCGTVPQSAPPALQDVVEPVRDPDGALTDWRALPAASTDQRIAFIRWRQNFVLERVLGDVAMVRSFLRWADHHLDVSAVHVLTLGSCRMEPAVLGRAEYQVKRANDVLRSRGETGLAVSSPERHGVIRGFAIDDAPVLLLAGGDARISAVRDGVHVDTGGREAVVTGWENREGTVTAHTAEGEDDLSAGAAGQLLCRLAPGVDRAQAGPAPLATIFAPLLTFLPDLAHVAAVERKPLVVTAR